MIEMPLIALTITTSSFDNKGLFNNEVLTKIPKIGSNGKTQQVLTKRSADEA